ncbi:sensor histidine kinase [Paenibacillus arenilitoris]|uniref:histidine kinase n=1 Tax=Paenibacillus arenilitoris TaxID=2772299 RepID=A0A927CJX3_9BACL|nr:HAMP domain-containing sensor histidine kinase [Paenibacillus arenilitoris]MBD2867251.1 HAMP domain-containing histidine kinase [Paenibacillus arenilitoris]
MRTIRIRTFTFIGLYAIFMIPWIFYIAAYYMENGTIRFATDTQHERLLRGQAAEMMRLIESGAGEWSDPDWQERLHDRLRQAKMDAAIYSASDEELFRSDPERDGPMAATERFSVVADGQLLGRVVLYLPGSNALQAVAAIAGLLLALFIVGFELRRFLLKPLERMSLAARQIADGDWDARLPSSRIKEIAEVRDGFDVMVKGLRQASRKQAELEEERRFVIAAVAHDLRTPLFALRGYLDGMEQGIARSPEKLARYLAVCKEKSAQLDRLVEDLFTFTKLEYLDAELHRSTVDVNRVMRDAIESLGPQAGRKHVAVTAEYAEEELAVVGDSHLLERAMNNLLDNAVRHTSPHGEISVRCRKDGAKVAFAIRDTGPGFSEEELQRAFEPLYRGEASRNRSTGGAGLGLTISRRIMLQHGGELAVGNDTYGGALLTGWLPGANQ